MGATRYVLLNNTRMEGYPKKAIIFLSTFLSNIYDYAELTKPLEINSSSKLHNGFNYSNFYKKSNDYVLVSSWDHLLEQSIVKLVRIRDGVIMHKWVVNIDYINHAHRSRNSIKLMHPSLLSDGSLLFGSEILYKVNKNSKIVWWSDAYCHHSIEKGLGNNYWFCSFNSSTKNAKKYQILDDAIKEVSAITGKILFEKSVFEILMANGYGRGNFFINAEESPISASMDYVHLNDIQPVLKDSKYWKKGDLFLSLRNQNMVMLYRPSTNKIIWSQNGPWLRQHDIDILDSTRIGIFGNNVIDAQNLDKTGVLIDGHNNQYMYDFSTNIITTPYEQLFKSSKIGTISEGLSRILKDETIFVEETNQGRIVFGDKNHEMWSYIDRIDKNKVSRLCWSTYITESEFKALDFIKKK